MKKYRVLINGFRVGMVYATDAQKALEKAAYEYGLNCDVEEY